jgi:rod shape-determining protein MreC
MRYEALERENARLRALRAAMPPLVERAEVTEVISNELSTLRQRMIVNRGVRNGGAFRSQTVVDARGVLGQIVRAGPWSSEVILITDPAHSIPVEVVRNGLRSIAVGAGNTGDLSLPYLAVNSDVKAGDLLVTSGLGGVFPAGYPVARVTGIKRDPVLLLAQVRAQPLATVERDREVMLLWFTPRHPAAPAGRDQTTLAPPPAAAAPLPEEPDDAGGEPEPGIVPDEDRDIPVGPPATAAPATAPRAAAPPATTPPATTPRAAAPPTTAPAATQERP